MRRRCKLQSFQDIPLLVPADCGRVTRSRSGISYGYDKEAFTAMVTNRYSKYARYLEDILESFKRRFEPWPNWLLHCMVHSILKMKYQFQIASHPSGV